MPQVVIFRGYRLMKINTMTKDKNIKTVVPALRFPEFRDAEGWEKTQLSKLGVTVSGLTYTPADVRDSGLLVLRSSNIKDGRIALDDCVYVTDDIKGANISQPKDILICVRNGSASLIGKNAIIPDNMPLCTHGAFMTVFRAQNPAFVFQLFQTDAYQTQVNADLGARINSINNSQLNKYKFAIPKQEEQQKIAGCLGNLDDLIRAVADKIETLKEYKKGLMQQLFPADGKTTPTLRFPEFQNAGEWKETTLGEEVYYENGKAHENDIDEAGQYIVVNSKFISTDGEVVKYTDNPSCLADKGDILMVLSDVPNGRAIAKCFIVDSDNKYTVNQRICKLKPKKTVGLLLYYIINRSPFLLAFDDGIKQTNLKKDDVLNCPFRIPKDPEEQQRIANSLSSVDDLISAETDKLDQLKAHKKGLMQQLFPTLNE